MISGKFLTASLQYILTCDISTLNEGGIASGAMLNSDGMVVCVCSVGIIEGKGNTFERVAIGVAEENLQKASDFLVGLSVGASINSGDEYASALSEFLVEHPESEPMVGLFAACPKIAGIESGKELATEKPDLFSVQKTFFIGQKKLGNITNSPELAEYKEDLPEIPIRKTVLNQVHKDSGAKMVPFAGWEMPVQYDGIFQEHKAVRTAAGLFDVSHMGIFEITGAGSEYFLETVLTNCVAKLRAGRAQYNYILMPDGSAVDDTFLYRKGVDEFLLVVNASNAEKVWAWFEAVLSGEVCIDTEMPWKKVGQGVNIRNLRDAGDDSLVDLAIQGPLSKELLLSMADSDEDKNIIESVKMNRFARVNAGGINFILCGTGYTGEKVGFEIFVHPDKAVELWGKLLKAGEGRGVMQCGLGARDSLRIEAGFPLFGHEIEGDLGLTLMEAGYSFVTKFGVPFFVGRKNYITKVKPLKRKVVRLRGKGNKSLRAGHLIIDSDGNSRGIVTSFAFLDEDKNFMVIACVDADFELNDGDSVKGYRAAKINEKKGVEDKKVVELTSISRFPSDEEKDSWVKIYL
jgi:glycine hydroxymethyltransferase